MTTQAAAGPLLDGDENRRRGLNRMRAVAASLLVFAAVIYLLTLDRDGTLGYVHAASEAAVVGAVADWFAVTALFRHPLGLPIPHTALIPTRKGALARSLQEFVSGNFLTEDVVRGRVADADVSLRVGSWLRDEAHSRRVVDEAVVLVRLGLQKVQDEDVRALLESEVLPRLAEEPLSEVAGRLLGDVVEEGAHHGLVELALTEAHQWLVANPESFAAVLTTRAPWWTPQWLDERVVTRMHLEMVAWVDDIRADPQHRARVALDELLAQLATDLQLDPETMARAERLKARLLGQPQVLNTATALWRALRTALDEALARPESAVRQRAVTALAAFGERLEGDDDLRARTDGYVADAAAFLVGRYGDELTTVITDTIDRWDGHEAARRIELHVGRDLQFIRINGTVVGGLVGLLIHAVTQLL